MVSGREGLVGVQLAELAGQLLAEPTASRAILVIKNLVPFYHTTAMRQRIGIIRSDKNPTTLSSIFAVCIMNYKAIT